MVSGSGTATFNFSGGTLRPFNANTTFGSTTSGSNFTITLSSTGATISGLDQATNTARTVDVYTPLAGTGGITFSGGTTTLRTANTHSGTTAVSAGTLVLTDANALQNSTYSGNGGALAFGVASATTFNFGGLAGSSPLTLTSTNNSSVTLVVGGNNASTTFSGNLSGTNATGITFNKVGTGTMTISGNWVLGADGVTSDGIIRVTTGEIRQTAGTVALRRNRGSGGLIVGELGSTAAYTVESGTLAVFNSNNPVDSSARIGGGGTGTVSINGASASVRLSGTANNLGGNDLGVASGTGTINLTAGELAVNSLTTGTAAGATGIFNFSGGTLRPYSQDTSIGTSGTGFTIALAGTSATFSGLDAAAGTARTLTVLTTLVDGTSGAAAAIFSGGTVSLSAANTYSGATTIAGTNTTLGLGSAGSFANSPTIRVGNAGSSGVVLDLTSKTSGFTFGSGQTVGGIGTINIGAGVMVTSNGIWAPGNSIGSNAVTGNLAVSGTSQFELGTPGSSASAPGLSDFTAVSGTLALGGALTLLDNAGANGNGTAAGGVYRLFTYGNAVTGSYASVTAPNAATRTSLSQITYGGSGTAAGQGVFLSVYNLASAAATQTVNLGNTRVGTALTGTLTLTNTAPNNATYTETLSTGSFSSTTAGFTASGSASNIVGGGTGSGTLLVGLGSGLGAGAQTGTTTLALFSNAVNSSGLAQQSIGSQTITITGTMYNPASANSLPASVTLGNIRVGSAFGTQSLSIWNTGSAATAFQEGLNASIASTAGSASGSGSITNLYVAGGTSIALSVGLGAGNQGTAGVVSGTATIGFATNGTLSGLSNASLASQNVAVSGAAYDFAQAKFSGATLNFGVVHQGAGVASQTVAFGNQTVTSASFQDSLDVSATTGNARVTATGFTGLAASADGSTTNNLSVSVSTATAGSLASTLSLTLTSNANGVSGLSNGTAATVGGGTITTTGGIFSGTGSWSQATGGSWGTGANANWTSVESVSAAPGTFAGYANTDAAIFGSAVSSGTASIKLNGAEVSLASIKFDNAAARYVIESGTGAGSFALAAATGKPVVDVVGIHEIAAAITGTNGLQKTGLGKLILSGSNNYSGGTDISAGTLVVNGFLGGTVNVANAAILGGSGVVGGVLSGAGVVSPGNSPGILTAEQFNPAGGLGAAFEFTSLTPVYTSSTASLNDVLRLTNGTPFVSSLTSGNVINVYFNLDSIAMGQTYEGGFFTGLSANELYTAVQNASFNYWIKDVNGATVFNGVNYSTLTSVPGITGVTLTTFARTADFGGGNVTGSVTQFAIVPEPGAVSLAGVGVAVAGWAAARRRRWAS